MTPFQRQVIAAARKWEAEQERERQQELHQQAGGGGADRPRNSRASGGTGGQSGLGQEETVRYINKQENPDHPVFQDE